MGLLDDKKEDKEMKRLVTALALTFTLAFSTPSHAALVDNGGGLIYDTDSNITWYDQTPGANSLSGATAWAAGLDVGGTLAGSWRLPNYLDNELGHLYYAELGNIAYGWPDLQNKGPFSNIAFVNEPYGCAPSVSYWTSFEDQFVDPENGYVESHWILFNFYKGDYFGVTNYTYPGANDYDGRVLAVHDGNVGAFVPLPNTILLFTPVLVGLLGLKRKYLG